MVKAAKEKGITAVVVSPNSSAHDYLKEVAYANAMKAAAEETGAVYADLSGISYDFYQKYYGSDTANMQKQYNFTSDTLHHNWYGAMNCARIVAQEMYTNGITFVDTEFSTDFVDTVGNEMIFQVGKEPASVQSPEETPSDDVNTIKPPQAAVTMNGLLRTTAKDGTVADSWYCTLNLNGTVVNGIEISVPETDVNGKLKQEISTTCMSGESEIRFGVVISYSDIDKANLLNYTPTIKIQSETVTALEYTKKLLGQAGSELLNDKNILDDEKILSFEF